MTELERIEIGGFKGLESISFEPSGINLITGRNNTGKTSLLEVIDLLFNPENTTKFGKDIDRTINIDSEECQIRGEHSGGNLTVGMRRPEEEAASQYFIQALLKYVYMNTAPWIFEFRMVPVGEEGPKERENTEEKREEVISTIRDALQKEIRKGDLSALSDEFIVITVEGEPFPYYVSGRKSKEIVSIVRENLGEKSEAEESNDAPNSAHTRIASSVATEAEPEGAKGFLETPENTGAVNFIESIELTTDVEITDEEKDAIKIDDIGDYIKEKELVDDLKTFDIDYLVFEKEDGEKYQVPYNFMGDGFKAIVGLLWELLDENNENDIVLLEEPENHMHPGYIREVVYFLVELARDEGVQLFITTHNSDFINSFFTENLTDEEEEYLEEEFSLIRMEEDTAVVEDYATAKDDLKNLHLDLRGI